MPRHLCFVVLTGVFVVLLGCASSPQDDDVHGDDDAHGDDDSSHVLDDDDSTTNGDLDGDGWTESEGDCDDGNAAVHPGADEACDGRDNDCDDEIDEGFDDFDGDGVADCVDEECEAVAPLAMWSGIVESCPWTGTPAVDPWSVVVEWQYNTAVGTFGNVTVANLTDDNADGEIDERDTPDIVCAMNDSENDHLVALHGDGSGLIWDVEGGFGEANVAVADLDLDGSPDIVTTERYGAGLSAYDWVAFDNEGNELWRRGPNTWGEQVVYPLQATVADVDGDRQPEVVTEWEILDGATGTQEAVLSAHAPGSGTQGYWYPVLRDLDFDGLWEIIQRTSVYAHDGSWLWDGPESLYEITATAIADLDGDGDAEVVMLVDTYVYVFSETGLLLAQSDELPSEGGNLTLADFDGDGLPEIGVAARFDVLVIEADGSISWTSPDHYDYSLFAGCSAFDFNLDGAYDLVCLDEVEVRFFDGQTGDTMFVWTDYESATGHAVPAIADVDGDGSAEIVVPCDNIWGHGEGVCRGITVLGHDSDTWPPSGPLWSVMDYTPMRIRPDSRVEMEIVAPWSVYNMDKSRPPADGLADLVPVLGETCLASCDPGLWQITWGAANQGLVNVHGPVSVALYRIDNGVPDLIAVETIDNLQYGYQGPGAVLSLPRDDWGDGLLIAVDDDGSGSGAVDECDEGNNTVELAPPDCP